MSKPNHGKYGGSGMTCPHCGQKALIRRTEIMSDLSRQKTYRCQSDTCGHVFVAIEEIVRTVVPPRVAKPGVKLPLAQHHTV